MTCMFIERVFEFFWILLNKVSWTFIWHVRFALWNQLPFSLHRDPGSYWRLQPGNVDARSDGWIHGHACQGERILSLWWFPLTDDWWLVTVYCQSLAHSLKVSLAWLVSHSMYVMLYILCYRRWKLTGQRYTPLARWCSTTCSMQTSLSSVTWRSARPWWYSHSTRCPLGCRWARTCPSYEQYHFS